MTLRLCNLDKLRIPDSPTLLTSHTSVCPGASCPDAGTIPNGSCSAQVKCSPASPTFLMGSCCTQSWRTGTQSKSTAGGSCSLLAGSTAASGTMMLLEPVITSSSSVCVWRVLGRKATCRAAATEGAPTPESAHSTWHAKSSASCCKSSHAVAAAWSCG